MADAANGEGVVGNTEEIQNQENENCENALVESESTSMEVDAIDGTVEEACTGGGESKLEDGNLECGGNGVQAAAAVTDSVSEECQGKVSEDGDVLEVKAETTDEGGDGGVVGSESVAGEGTSVSNAQATTETKVVVKQEDGGDADTYMVLEEADGDDNNSMSESDDEEELTENELLRKANLELNERLALLEEFIEVEFSDKFGKFLKKRGHLVDVMGFGQKTSDLTCNGKRSSKSLELVGLLKLVKDQSKTNGRNFGNSNPTQNKASTTKVEPRAGGSNTKKEEPSSDANQKRCHRCRATGHIVRNCPLPIDPRDRRVILKKETRRRRREKDRLEAIQNPKIKAMKDKRRRISRALTRERRSQNMK